MIVLAVIGALFLLAFVPLVILYAAFLAVAPWFPAHKAGTLTAWRKWLLLVAYLWDVAINRTLLVLLLWDRARELTVTARMNRYLEQGSGNRYLLARAVCAELNRHDPGHCNC